MLQKTDIPNYAPKTIKLPDGRSARIEMVPDESMGEPWLHGSHFGIVSDWTRREKKASELILASDRGSHRYYDYAETVKIARRDGWGAEGGTAKERAAKATMRDYERLRSWCAGDWEWIGVTVTIGDELDSLWGIESDGDYWREVAADLINGLIGQSEAVTASAQVIASEDCYA